MQQPENRPQRYDQLFVGIDTGSIKIPKFQRDFVWNKGQTAELLDSLIKGYPIGTFIYWETMEELRNQKEIGNWELPATPKGYPVSYVLDGQQRITSLYAVRKGVVFTKENGERINYKDIVIDLSQDPDSDDQIVLASANESPAIPVYELLNMDSITAVIETYTGDQIKRLEEYKKRLENYSFSTIIIDHKYSIDVATDVFTRINTGGTTLTLFEIMVAKTYSERRNFDLLQKYNDLTSNIDSEKNLATANYETIRNTIILQCVAICLSGETRRRDILRLDKDEFISSWDTVKESIFAAVDFLRDYIRVPVSNLLPYDVLLVPLTYFFFKYEREPTLQQKKLLTQYFWWASLSSRFSSSVDSNVSSDRRRIERILDGGSPNYRGEEVELTQRALKEHVFSAGDAFSKAILCLYASFRPRSFDTGADVRIDNTWLKRRDSKNYHHFFPISYLKKNGIEDWVANSIMNITIVDEYLNKGKIRAKAPSVYMRPFSEENDEIDETMKSHLIDDLDESGIWRNDYENFLDTRAKRVLEELEKRLPPKL